MDFVYVKCSLTYELAFTQYKFKELLEGTCSYRGYNIDTCTDIYFCVLQTRGC